MSDSPPKAICVWHVNPDNIVYVGPYTEEEARAALSALEGFEHYDAEPDIEQEESWQKEHVGGSEGVSLSIEECSLHPSASWTFDYQPSQLLSAINVV